MPAHGVKNARLASFRQASKVRATAWRRAASELVGETRLHIGEQRRPRSLRRDARSAAASVSTRSAHAPRGRFAHRSARRSRVPACAADSAPASAPPVPRRAPPARSCCRSCARRSRCASLQQMLALGGEIRTPALPAQLHAAQNARARRAPDARPPTRAASPVAADACAAARAARPGSRAGARASRVAARAAPSSGRSRARASRADDRDRAAAARAAG